MGYDALPESEKGVMDLAKMIREDYLQQSAYDPVDTYTSIRKQYLMMKTILTFGKMEADAIKSGAQAAQVSTLPGQDEDIEDKVDARRPGRRRSSRRSRATWHSSSAHSPRR